MASRLGGYGAATDGDAVMASGGDALDHHVKDFLKGFDVEVVAEMQSEATSRTVVFLCDDIVTKIEGMQKCVPPLEHTENLVSLFGTELKRICSRVGQQVNVFFDLLFSRCQAMTDYLATAHAEVQSFHELFKSQWMMHLEPYSQFIKAADAGSSNKLLLPMESLYDWVMDLTEGWCKFEDFVKVLGCDKSVIPEDAAAMEREWSEALSKVGRDEGARAAYAHVCVASQKLDKLKEHMAAGQKQAYERWLRKGLNQFVNLLVHLSQNNSSIVNSAIADMEKSMVTVPAQQLIQELSGTPPLINSDVLEYVQPQQMIQECLDMANSGMNPSATRAIAAKVALSQSKHFMVKAVKLTVVAETIQTLMPAIKAVDSFCAEVQKIKNQEEDNSLADDVSAMGLLMKTSVVAKWIRMFQKHLDDNIVKHIPRDFTAVVSSQVTASINQMFFTRGKVLLMQSLDEAGEHFDHFKKLGVLAVLDSLSADQQLMGNFARVEANMKVCNEYALTWDCLDLILNKLPATGHSAAEKVAFIKEFFFVFVLVCVLYTVCVVVVCWPHLV